MNTDAHHGDRETVQMDELRNIDHPAYLVTHDANLGFPILLGFCCGTADGGLLTMLDPDSAEQMFVTREQLEWLRDVGIPAWLANPEAQRE